MSNISQENLVKKLKEIIPKSDIIYSEKGPLNEILCKPKILPLKSLTLQKLEEMEKQFAENIKNASKQQ